ncbi:MAG: urease accessory protein UreF [Deferrisomatales bacterium]
MPVGSTSTGEPPSPALPALVRLLHLASPALPVGAFSYSQGLESAVELGWVTGREGAGQWIGDALELAVGRLEAPVWLRLHAAWARGDEAVAARWNELFLASRDTAEGRAETAQMGYSLGRLLEDLDPARFPALAGWTEPTFPVQFARAAAAWGVPAEEGLTAYLWAWLENQVMAAVKAVPLGQTDGQRLLLALGERLPRVVRRAREAGDDDLAGGAPALGLAGALHETQYSRLFRS